jgi:tetratricopeptide (TPR) repeat protein
MKELRLLYVFILFFLRLVSYSQNNDSLWNIYNNKSLSDTNRIKAIHSIAWSYTNNNPDTAILLANFELELANSIPSKKGKMLSAGAYNTMGVAFELKGNYPKSLECFLKALKVCEETGNKKGVGACYGSIGIVYKNQSDYSKALEYGLKNLKIAEELKDNRGVARCYGNIGLIYSEQNSLLKALDYHLKSLKLAKEVGDKNLIETCYSNIGIIYVEQFNYPEALTYYLSALQLSKEIDDQQGVGTCYVNLSDLYNKLANYKQAICYGDSALQITKQTDDIDNASLAYENLAIAYSKTGKYKQAYENHVKFKTLIDSIFNADNSKQLGDMKTKFEVEKKEAELKIKSVAEQEKLKAVSSEEKKRQEVIIASVAGVLTVVIVFSLFLYKRFRITNRQKNIIEKQKQKVDEAYAMLHEKNKEVIDSIYYARRIQRVLITSEKYIENSLNRLIKK